MAWLECWAHQIHLMTGNYLAIASSFLEVLSEANKLIKWWNNHSYALAELWAYQMLLRYLILLVFLVAVATRWLSNFCSLNCVVWLENAVCGCVRKSRAKLLVAGGILAAAKEKAEEILTICERETFWLDLKRLFASTMLDSGIYSNDSSDRLCTHLKPLAIAANLFQAPYCRLDHVLLGLGHLYWSFKALPAEDALVTTKMHTTLEKCWKDTNQELFILGVFFNPFTRARCFNRNALSNSLLYTILTNTVKQFVCNNDQERKAIDINYDLFAAFNQYNSCEERYHPKAMCLKNFESQAEQLVSPWT